MKSGLRHQPPNPACHVRYYMPPYKPAEAAARDVHISHSTFQRRARMSSAARPSTVAGIVPTTSLPRHRNASASNRRDRGNEIADMRIERLTMTD